MKDLILFKLTRLILIGFLPGIILFVTGCATTSGGKFANLTLNESTSEEVRDLLGEPSEIRSEEENDIWTYTFLNVSGSKTGFRKQKVLETEFIFDEEVMTDYKVSVVTKKMPEMGMKKPHSGNAGQGPRTKELGSKARHFLDRFDLNRDGQITRKEYSGPPQMFTRMDGNHDNIIDQEEIRRFRFKK